MEDLMNQINQYIYPEYVVAVIIATAFIRWAFNGIDQVIHAKWITFQVGVLLGIVGYVFKIFQGETFDVFKLIISFGISCMGYDYFVKVIKDKITQIKVNNNFNDQK